MTAADVKAALDAGAIPLDLRTPRPFAAEHLPGAVNLQFNRADLADRADLVLPRDRRYIIHMEPEPVARIAVRLLQEAGFAVEGHLEGGLRAWREAGLPTETIAVLDVDELRDRLGALPVVDVREGYEYRHTRIPGALNLPWTEAWERAAELPGGPFAVVCGDEVRSAAGASILRRAGLEPLLVTGGMADWLEKGYPVEKGAR